MYVLDLQYSDSGSSELEEVETKVAAEAMVQLSVPPPYPGNNTNAICKLIFFVSANKTCKEKMYGSK